MLGGNNLRDNYVGVNRSRSHGYNFILRNPEWVLGIFAF